MKRIFKNVMIPMLNISGGLKNCGGDEEKYLDLLRSYVIESGRLTEQIKTVEKNNLNAYAVIVRKIKKTSGIICAGPIQDLAEDLEMAAAGGHYEIVKEKTGDLIEAVAYLSRDINKTFT